ncbi:hypothetical protein BGAL_0599g00030 [Botrytis galanthina]|uniref:Uncharacterized protein n=1 Tax=Botrytis galanthina TaxID=278940 RepID=A0A4V4HT90_9HELO|nr:hypothetical protein BGAL_0599g00030 [Botrytis galanthina]
MLMTIAELILMKPPFPSSDLWPEGLSLLSLHLVMRNRNTNPIPTSHDLDGSVLVSGETFGSHPTCLPSRGIASLLQRAKQKLQMAAAEQQHSTLQLAYGLTTEC